MYNKYIFQNVNTLTILVYIWTILVDITKLSDAYISIYFYKESLWMQKPYLCVPSVTQIPKRHFIGFFLTSPNFFLEQLWVHGKIVGNVQRLFIYSSALSRANLHYQCAPSVWYITYNWWTYIDKLYSPKVYSLH